MDVAGSLFPVEIKSGMTLTSDWFTGMRRWMELAGDSAINPCLFYGGNVESIEAGIQVLPWHPLAQPEQLLNPLR